MRMLSLKEIGWLSQDQPHSKCIHLARHSLWQRVRAKEAADSPAQGGSAQWGKEAYQESWKEGKACEAVPQVSQDGHVSPALTCAAGEGTLHGEQG